MQIQLPDEIYKKAKQLARAKEISLAELTRRGIECFLQQFPHFEQGELEVPYPPPLKLGWRGFSHEEVKDFSRHPHFPDLDPT